MLSRCHTAVLQFNLIGEGSHIFHCIAPNRLALIRFKGESKEFSQVPKKPHRVTGHIPCSCVYFELDVLMFPAVFNAFIALNIFLKNFLKSF